MNVYVLCTVSTGLDTVRWVSQAVPLAGWIGLDEMTPGDAISGYKHMAPEADRLGIPFIPVQNYALSEPGDKERLLELDIDILLVLGWQRLVPEWFIQSCKKAIVGGHGSSRGITEGRGRSPQNWALLLGHRSFEIAIFRIDAGIDSGGIIDKRRFPLTERDDIRSSYYKASRLTAEMIVENVKNGRIVSGEVEPQTGTPAYLPQRLPDDGALDWSRSTAAIDRFVRALTRPYPGAFCEEGAHRLVVWGGRPFFTEGGREKPGTIITLFSGGEVLVATGDGSFLVEDFDLKGPLTLEEGQALPSVDFRNQIHNIVARHEAKYPDLSISPDILELIGRRLG